MNFVHGIDSVIKHTKNAAMLLETTFDSLNPHELREQCSEDVHLLIQTIPTVQIFTTNVQRQVRAIIELTGCHQINPILRRITMGATCSESVDALTWLMMGMWCITLLGFTMLSVRAGLFNSVIRAPRRKRQKEREKEFEEYKEYMAEFYEDTDQWQLELCAKNVQAMKDNLPRIPTFETEADNSSARSIDLDASDIACIASPLRRSDDSSNDSASSYESEYSSGSDDERSNLSLSILVGKMFHARHPVDQLQSPSVSTLSHDTNIRSLGILELQTPRRRRKYPIPTPFLGEINSPSSDDASSIYLASPDSHDGTTPQAPSKPKRTLYRTKGANKES